MVHPRESGEFLKILFSGSTIGFSGSAPEVSRGGAVIGGQDRQSVMPLFYHAIRILHEPTY
jgi:hypothetical protein